MPGFSVKDLMNVIQKSGLPTNGSSFNMSQASLGASDAIGAQVPQVPQTNDAMSGAKANYMAQLAQIAQMDAKLATTYSDPSSKLFIENPLKREGLIQGARKPGFTTADSMAGEYKNAKSAQEAKIKDREKQIADAESLYGKMTTLKRGQETEVKRQTAAAKKAAGTGKGTGTTTDVKVTKAETIAGFQDPNIANQWSNAEAKFRREWEDNVLSGKWKVPEGGFTQKNFDETYSAWLKDNPPAKKKTAADEIVNPFR